MITEFWRFQPQLHTCHKCTGVEKYICMFDMFSLMCDCSDLYCLIKYAGVGGGNLHLEKQEQHIEAL